MRYAALAVLLMTVSGCASSNAQLSTMSDWEVLNELDGPRIMSPNREGARAELDRRGVFTTEEWGRIAKRDVRIGDRKILVRAAWGSPARQSNSVSPLGKIDVWEYTQYTTFVTFKDGNVLAIDQLH